MAFKSTNPTEPTKSDYINLSVVGEDKNGKPFSIRLNGLPVSINGKVHLATARLAELIESGAELPEIHFSVYRATDAEEKQLPF